MKCSICQWVKIVDMNNEALTEQLFVHGEIEGAALTVGASVVTHSLGLKKFEVVYDKREGIESARFKVVDIEVDMLQHPFTTRAYLEPQVLIIGQHDVGETE
ncbi:hypothetical protein [Paenibacillus sp. UNC499MF]|uniref:hypothetical protein n=1 Tax=Paenibacillus sp. UNC499MF TaxID=1502751 RepID=UPI0008A07196|nr:hypothetical protein [Paenibacillus sp. UNC499MF]SEF94777.1 hypothetical protein SAMN02799616_01544 [Paenibacillus sp. UNC499MF]